MRINQRRASRLLATALLLLLASSTAPAVADPAAPTRLAYAGSVTARSTAPAAASRAMRVARIPDTPYLPPYPAQMISPEVSSEPQADGGVVLTISFQTNERSKNVLAWYRSAFNSNGWAMDPQSMSEFRVRAQRGKSIFTSVAAMDSAVPGRYGQVQLYYRIVGRDM